MANYWLNVGEVWLNECEHLLVQIFKHQFLAHREGSLCDCPPFFWQLKLFILFYNLHCPLVLPSECESSWLSCSVSHSVSKMVSFGHGYCSMIICFIRGNPLSYMFQKCPLFNALESNDCFVVNPDNEPFIWIRCIKAAKCFKHAGQQD